MYVEGRVPEGSEVEKTIEKSGVSYLYTGLLVLIFISFSSPLGAGSVPVISNVVESAAQSIPAEFGSVIYSCNEGSPNQLFIVGISHRDIATRRNGATTVQAQVEVYRIAEWLIRNRGLGLLLPEGFFSEDRVASRTRPVYSLPDRSRTFLDAVTLEARLGDDMKYVNAEMLLSERHAIQIRQVEDFDLYAEVISRVKSLEKNRRDAFASLFIQADLDYLQDRRTAVMLQKIPDIIDYEYSEGTISSKEALFTIGLAHISGIIRYLEQKAIAIQSPAFTAFEDYTAEVNLLNKDFGVTVIVPRSLASDREFLLALQKNDI
jgi:hypothetical protein